jgi:hypothetical protein
VGSYDVAQIRFKNAVIGRQLTAGGIWNIIIFTLIDLAGGGALVIIPL